MVTEFDQDYESLCQQMDQIKVTTEKMLVQVETLIQPNPSELCLLRPLWGSFMDP